MKHSKLFLTGMAALLLSFGLMMTGCDSGGGSDDPSESPDDYFVITRTNPGSSTGGDYAVFTVQVKKSLAGKQVEFANVAAGNVTYTNADADTTIASQTTALIGFFTTQATKYGAAVEGTTTDTVKLTATENPPAEIPVANGPKVVDVTDIPAPPPEDTWLPPAASGEDGVFTVVADADSVTAVGEIHYAAGTVTYWTTEKVTKTIGAGPLQTLLLTLAATDTFTIAVVNNVEQIINITINGTTADVPTGKTLTVGAGTTLDTGAAGVLAVTGTLVVGSGGNTVTITNAASITSTLGTTGLGAGATGLVTLSDEVVVLAGGGSIVVAGTGKIALPNTVINAGTYTAAGDVTITAASGGDTIATEGDAVTDAFTLGGQLKLGQNDASTAATYTFTKGGAGAKVIIAGATVTVPADSTSGAKLATDGKAKITLGTGSITLKSAVTIGSLVAGTFDLANGDEIGVFTDGTQGSTNSTVESITGGAVLGSAKAGALDGATGAVTNATLTVGAAGLNLEGGVAGAADAVISASAVVTTAA